MNTLLQAAGNIWAKTGNNLKIEVNELLKMYLSQVLLLFLLSKKRAKQTNGHASCVMLTHGVPSTSTLRLHHSCFLIKGLLRSEK